jgi:hypothetical protein
MTEIIRFNKHVELRLRPSRFARSGGRCVELTLVRLESAGDARLATIRIPIDRIDEMIRGIEHLKRAPIENGWAP